MSKQFDFEAFKAFVAGKPAEETYPWFPVTACALGQFGFEVGNADEHEGTDLWFAYDCAMTDPLTWGALSKRLNALSSRLEGVS